MPCRLQRWNMMPSPAWVRSRRTAAALGAALLALCAGCSSIVAQDRLARRSDDIDFVLGRIAWRESQNPEYLRHAGWYINKSLQEDALALAEDGRLLGRRWDGEVQDWQDYQPIYADKAAQIFGGKPAQIENSALRMFY